MGLTELPLGAILGLQASKQWVGLVTFYADSAFTSKVCRFVSIFRILHKLCIDMWLEVCCEESRCLNREDLNGVFTYGSTRRTVVSVQIPEGFFSICCI